MSSVKKRKAFSLSEKIAMIRDYESGKKQAAICKEKQLASSTLATILKNRDKIMNLAGEFSSKTKKLRSASNPKLDKAVLKWFRANRESNIPINGLMLKEKAQQFSEHLGESPELKWSNGWLNRFKGRHNINCGKICGEAKSASLESIENWLSNTWPRLRANYSDENIFNAHELGLFYKLTPEKTLKFKNESCKGGKLSKDRITALVCANLTGSEKFKLLVIGKAAKPRCFKGIQKLPVDYESNRRAWMTSTIFEKIVREWDIRLTRKILLLVDNCTAHSQMENLQHIQLEYLPPNVTSVLQPMDQGIIRSLKAHYRKIMVKRLVEDVEKKKQTTISLLDAVNYLHKAWSLVEGKTVRNCFQHARWQQSDFDEDDELPLADWIKIQANEPNDSVHSSFINFDENVATCATLTDNDILEEILDPLNSAIEDEEEEINDAETSATIPSIEEVEKSLKTVRDFLLMGTSTPYHDVLFANLVCLENATDDIKLHQHRKQSKITDFLFKSF